MFTGNENQDACNSSPARAEKPVTVGAMSLQDERAYFSNHGTCVDVFGPGVNILSTYKGGPTTTAVLSGTSMASPHVAGLLAYLLSIYPSETFPEIDGSVLPISGTAQSSFSAEGVYSVVRAALPGFISEFLPSPWVLETVVAPVPKRPTLSPADLKEQLLKLSLPDLLTDIPSNTVNKLIYNNIA